MYYSIKPLTVTIAAGNFSARRTVFSPNCLESPMHGENKADVTT